MLVDLKADQKADLKAVELELLRAQQMAETRVWRMASLALMWAEGKEG